VNAIRHTPADATVRIEASAVAGPGPAGAHAAADAQAPAAEPHVRISVTDACGGIPADDLDRVFDVAWRGTPARTPETDSPIGAGAGLGLAIVRGIAEAHSGEVTVDNVEGGCRFQMQLPVLTG
ncbi:MAG: sensor histidine kinase, partial [Catenulispora sp.]|nr:sensor histidine kinase [Catenulispora sp.]